MSTAATPDMNVKQVVPFFRISDVEHSIRFDMHGLGFTMKHRWLVDEKLRWCWLELGGAALMLHVRQRQPQCSRRKVRPRGRALISVRRRRENCMVILFRALIPGIFPVRSAVSMLPRQRAKRFQ
jgi:hypothetical protein